MSDAAESFKAAMLAALGHAPDTIEPGRLQRFSTNGRRSDSSGWCKLFSDLRGGVFGCYRAGLSEVWRAVQPVGMSASQRAALARQIMRATAERKRLQRELWAANAKRIAELSRALVRLVPGDPVTLYLKRRGLAGVWPLPPSLRLHRGLDYWHEGQRLGTFPAMVAPVTAQDGRVVALHRTYLCADGRKADVPSVKKLTGAAGPLAGACIALHKPARGCIGIAEGIETALAAWCGSGVPTVAAYCAGNLAAWRWPAQVPRVVVFADADKAGRDSAESLRARVLAAGKRCEVLTPSEDGADWCDVWAARQPFEVPA